MIYTKLFPCELHRQSAMHASQEEKKLTHDNEYFVKQNSFSSCLLFPLNTSSNNNSIGTAFRPVTILIHAIHKHFNFSKNLFVVGDFLWNFRYDVMKTLLSSPNPEFVSFSCYFRNQTGGILSQLHSDNNWEFGFHENSHRSSKTP